MTKDEIVAAIERMTVLELKELVDTLQEKFGVSAAIPMVAAGPAAGGGDGSGAAAVEEQTEFTVKITDVGDKKIQVIKAVREVVPSLGLKEAKDLVESVPNATVAEAISKDEAEKIKAKLEESGATVEVK